VLDPDSAALDVAALAESLLEGANQALARLARSVENDADSRRLSCLLGLGRERRGDDPASDRSRK
jgi:hypothetical protein